jgi:hypothetical protein
VRQTSRTLTSSSYEGLYYGAIHPALPHSARGRKAIAWQTPLQVQQHPANYSGRGRPPYTDKAYGWPTQLLPPFFRSKRSGFSPQTRQDLNASTGTTEVFLIPVVWFPVISLAGPDSNRAKDHRRWTTLLWMNSANMQGADKFFIH